MDKDIDREATIEALDSRDEYDDLVNTIREQPAADVQPLSIVAEHIKQRLYETALNEPDTVASDVIADMAERIDYWINELKDGEQKDGDQNE